MATAAPAGVCDSMWGGGGSPSPSLVPSSSLDNDDNIGLVHWVCVLGSWIRCPCGWTQSFGGGRELQRLAAAVTSQDGGGDAIKGCRCQRSTTGSDAPRKGAAPIGGALA